MYTVSRHLLVLSSSKAALSARAFAEAEAAAAPVKGRFEDNKVPSATDRSLAANDSRTENLLHQGHRQPELSPRVRRTRLSTRF